MLVTIALVVLLVFVMKMTNWIYKSRKSDSHQNIDKVDEVIEEDEYYEDDEYDEDYEEGDDVEEIEDDSDDHEPKNDKLSKRSQITQNTCKNCGAELRPGAVFCTKCGTKV